MTRLKPTSPPALLAGLSVLALVLVGATDTEDLAEVEKQLIERWQQHEVGTAKIEIKSEFTEGGRTATQKGAGRLTWMRRDDKTMMYSQMQINAHFGDQVRKQRMLTISDGDLVYQVTSPKGRRPRVVKLKASDHDAIDLRDLFRQLRAKYDLALRPEETLGERAVYVVQATASGALAGDPFREKTLYFDKEHGVLLRLVGKSEEPQGTQEITYSEFDFSVTPDPESFVYEPPPNARVIDKTKP